MHAPRWFLAFFTLFTVACSGMAPYAAKEGGAYDAPTEAEGAPVMGGMAAPGLGEAYADEGLRGELAQVDGADLASEAPAPPPPPPPAPPSPSQPDAQTSPERPEAIKPLLIYMATYHMAVFETEKAIDAVQTLAKELDGYLVRRDDTSIVVRIPSERYRGALDRIGKLGDVIHREETVEDVTEQFMDLMTRLRNARVVRDRLAQLLAQAKDVKDALEVERELARVTTQIEVMEGKLKRLRELVAFSTITVRFEPVPSEQIRSNVRLPFPWLERIGLQNLLNL